MAWKPHVLVGEVSDVARRHETKRQVLSEGHFDVSVGCAWIYKELGSLRIDKDALLSAKHEI